MGRGIVALALVACGGGSSATPDASKVVDAAPPDSVGHCNALTLPTSMVEQMNVADVMPTPSGGTLDPGTYVLTSWTNYTGAGGPSGPVGMMVQSQLVVDGTNYQYIAGVSAGVGPTITDLSGTYQLDGTGTDMTIQGCPSIAHANYGYDASPTQFTLYLGQSVLAFDKQ
jgi:hypothetical protein